MEKLIRLLGLESHEPIELVSPHSAEECLRRLKESVGSGWAIFSRRSVVGRIQQSSFRLQKRLWYQNSFQPILFCNLHQQLNDTQLTCRFGMLPRVTIFLAIWVLAVIVIGVPLMISELSDYLSGNSDLPEEVWMLFIPLLMLVFVYVLVKFGQFLSRNEPKFLIEFLREKLDATQSNTN